VRPADTSNPREWRPAVHNGKIIDGQKSVADPSLYTPLTEEEQLDAEYALYCPPNG
jgi:hypothetical protein